MADWSRSLNWQDRQVNQKSHNRKSQKILTPLLFFCFSFLNMTLIVHSVPGHNVHKKPKITLFLPPPRNPIRTKLFIQIYTVNSLWDKTEFRSTYRYNSLCSASWPFILPTTMLLNVSPDKRKKCSMLKIHFLRATILYFLAPNWPDRIFQRCFFISF